MHILTLKLSLRILLLVSTFLALTVDTVFPAPPSRSYVFAQIEGLELLPMQARLDDVGAREMFDAVFYQLTEKLRPRDVRQSDFKPTKILTCKVVNLMKCELLFIYTAPEKAGNNYKLFLKIWGLGSENTPDHRLEFEKTCTNRAIPSHCWSMYAPFFLEQVWQHILTHHRSEP